MKKLLALAVVSLSACTQEPPPVTPATAPVTSAAPVPSASAPVASASSTPSAPPPVCIPANAAKGEVVFAEEKDGKLRACFFDEKVGQSAPVAQADETHPCVFVDVATGALSTAPSYKVPPIAELPPPAITVTVDKASVKVCKGSDCKTVKVSYKPVKKPKPKAAAKPGKKKGKPLPPPPPESAERSAVAFADDAMTRLFVFVPEVAKDGGTTVYGETYDLASGKRKTRTKLTNLLESVFVDGSNDWSGRWIGDKVVLRDQVCCGPGASIVLFDPSAAKMKLLHGYAGDFDQDPVSKDWYALSEKSMSFVDVGAMSITPVVTAGGESLDPEARSARWVRFGKQLAFVSANPPGFAMVDPATHKAGPAQSIAVCKP